MDIFTELLVVLSLGLLAAVPSLLTGRILIRWGIIHNSMPWFVIALGTILIAILRHAYPALPLAFWVPFLAFALSMGYSYQFGEAFRHMRDMRKGAKRRKR